MSPAIATIVRELSVLQPRERKVRLQSLVGATSIDRGVLHQRALLMTALREAAVWPPVSP